MAQDPEDTPGPFNRLAIVLISLLLLGLLVALFLSEGGYKWLSR